MSRRSTASEGEKIRQVANSGTHHIVFANEKGGTGKSTTAVHVAVALAYQGHKVAIIDLDPRQRTSYRYLENRVATMNRLNIDIPQPLFEVFEHDSLARLEQLTERMAHGVDYLLYDTPGRDDKFARFVATRANSLVTPINDSFVDFDLIGQVDPETYNLRTIALMDQQGNYRTIALESMSYNLGLEDKFFEFEVSAGMEVIEAENL